MFETTNINRTKERGEGSVLFTFSCDVYGQLMIYVNNNKDCKQNKSKMADF